MCIFCIPFAGAVSLQDMKIVNIVIPALLTTGLWRVNPCYQAAHPGWCGLRLASRSKALGMVLIRHMVMDASYCLAHFC